MPSINEILDRKYQIIREIGAGGGGIVFQGYHLTLCKDVVIKKIKEQAVGVLDIRGEADILKCLHHQYLPQVYDFLEIDGGIFTVMDYVDGHDLRWYMDQGIVFPEEELERMLLQLCEVLEYLHGQSPPIIHRDIKPGNIMIRNNGDVCLIDFNISFSENNQTFTGYSYQYASPEQIEASKHAAYGDPFFRIPDERADIYSLGATFFYLMTGIRPKDVKVQDWKRGKVQTAYSEAMLRIVRKAMAQKPERRYSSAAQMKRAVERSVGRAGNMIRAGAAGGFVILLVVLILGGMSWRREQREEAFASAYEAYVDGLAFDDAAERIRGGLSLLNERDYAPVLEEKPKQKAVILEGIADGYYEEENYQASADYYREAAAIQTDSIRKAEDVRDLILSLVRGGSIAEAEQKLETCQAELSSTVLQYLQVEFLLQKGQRQEALEQINVLLASAQDQEILLRCCLHGAECLQDTEEYARRIGYLDKAFQYQDTVLACRRIGDGYMQIVQEEPEETVYQAALDRAERCYEKLCADGVYTGYVDRLNLAAVRQMEGSYDSAQEMLAGLMEEYPDDYRAYRDAAFLRYQIEQKKAAQNRSSQPVLYYGELAFEYYDGKTEDEQMVRLQELMDCLTREQGRDG